MIADIYCNRKHGLKCVAAAVGVFVMCCVMYEHDIRERGEGLFLRLQPNYVYHRVWNQDCGKCWHL